MAVLKIVELRFRDWQSAAAWYEKHLQLKRVMEVTSQQFVLLDAGAIQLSIKGDAAVHASEQGLMHWEVSDVMDWHSREQAPVLKPLKISEEGYRRIIIEGPEKLALSVYDWLG